MPSKKVSARAAPKKSSSTAFTNDTATTIQLNRSSVIKHAIANLQSQSSLFASVVQGIDAQVLRIHDTVTGRQQCEHSLGDGKVSCLAWGRYGGGKQRAAKKRKTTVDGEGLDGEQVVAIGALNSPEVELYSPAQAKVVAVLGGAHTQGVKDFQFGARESSRKAWSLGGDGKLVEWNMHDGSVLRSIQLPSSPAQSNIIHTGASHVLCAQSNIYGINPESVSQLTTLTGFASNVHTMTAKIGVKDDASAIKSVVSAADGERNILVHDYQNSLLQGQMVANDAVEGFSLSGESHQSLTLLAAVTERGDINIFRNPFDFGVTDPKQAKSTKAAKRAMTKKPVATLKISRPHNEKETVPILEVAFDDNALVLAWMEGAAYPCFHRVEWRSTDGALLLDGDQTILKAKNQNVTTNARMNGMSIGRTQVNDAHTVVVKGGEAGDGEGMDVDGPEIVDISSAEEESSDEEAAVVEMGSEQQMLTNGASAEDEDMDGVLPTNSDDESADGVEVEQPSFGELLRAKAPEVVDVASAFPAQAQAALVPQGAKAVRLPSGMTLATVLSQALRTSDRQLLESCFHERDLKVVQATIEDLNSSLAGTLLEQLADRLHSRPGRAGSLMVWIKWTLIAHGGHLAGQPKVVKQLKQLQSVVKERAQALQPLLLLKGKLDMLDAQMQLRRSKVARSRQTQAAQEEEDDRTAIYIEGDPEIDSDEEEEKIDIGKARAGGREGVADAEDIEFDSDEEEEIDLGMEVDADEDEDEEDDSGNEFIDDEAEEADSDSERDGDDIDHDDVDSVDEDGDDSESEPEVAVVKAKPRAKTNGIVKRR